MHHFPVDNALDSRSRAPTYCTTAPKRDSRLLKVTLRSDGDDEAQVFDRIEFRECSQFRFRTSSRGRNLKAPPATEAYLYGFVAQAWIVGEMSNGTADPGTTGVARMCPENVPIPLLSK